MLLIRLGLFIGLLAVGVGCSNDQTSKDVAKLNSSNAQRLANLYAAHQNGKGGTGPKTEAAFKEFISSYAPEKLTMMGVDAANLDAVFKSERDGQPFKLRYNVGGGRGSVDPVVFEATGKDGKKLVAFTGGTTEEVDDARYAELLSGKAGRTAPAAGPNGPPAGGRPGSGGPPPGAPTGPPGG